MDSCEFCKDDYYPLYGCAPHECYWRKEGGFNNKLGTSTILELPKWPENFLVEIEPDMEFEDIFKYGTCGVHLCPKCLNGGIEKHECSYLLSKSNVIKKLNEKERLNK